MYMHWLGDGLHHRVKWSIESHFLNLTMIIYFAPSLSCLHKKRIQPFHAHILLGWTAAPQLGHISPRFPQSHLMNLELSLCSASEFEKPLCHLFVQCETMSSWWSISGTQSASLSAFTSLADWWRKDHLNHDSTGSSEESLLIYVFHVSFIL